MPTTAYISGMMFGEFYRLATRLQCCANCNNAPDASLFGSVQNGIEILGKLRKIQVCVRVNEHFKFWVLRFEFWVLGFELDRVAVHGLHANRKTQNAKPKLEPRVTTVSRNWPRSDRRQIRPGECSLRF